MDAVSHDPKGGARRHFVGWDGPLLPRAVAWVFERGERAGVLDLGEWVLVVSGARAGRLLLGELVDAAASRGATLVPPTIVTPGETFEAVLGAPGRRRLGAPAGPLAMRLAWQRAVASSAPGTNRALTLGHDSDGEGSVAAVDVEGLASTLARVHAEVGGHGLRLESIARHARSLGGDAESERWLAAAAVERAYAEVLASWGLHDVALERLGQIETLESARAAGERDGGVRRVGVGESEVAGIVLIGLPELPGVVRRALALSTRPVDAIVHAPRERSDGFDSFGCVLAESWADGALPVPDEQLVFASTRTDAIDRALAELACVRPAPEAREVVVGIADESLAEPFRERASLFTDVAIRHAGGMDPSRTPPIRLLGRVRDLLMRRDFESLMLLVRHPDVERFLVSESERGDDAWWLAPLDEYGATQVPARLSSLPRAVEAEHGSTLAFVLSGVGGLLGALAGRGLDSELEDAPLADWAGAILGVLERVYGDGPLRSVRAREHFIAEACKAVVASVEELLSLGGDCVAEGPAGGGADRSVVRLLDAIVSDVCARAIPEPPSASAIEMVGWLELAADPARVAVVVGMNEGAVPSTRETDPMLPGALRREAGIPGARERLARDSFLMTTIARSRPFVRFIAPRRDDDGSPLLPSRLMLRTVPEGLPARLSRALGHDGDGPARVRVRPLQAPATVSAFRTAVVAPASTPRRIRVTAFKDYLASPYLFYLRHVLNLVERDAPGMEMDRLVFGSLVHESLESFARSDERGSADAGVVRDRVLDALHQSARDRFGASPRALIAVQVEHAAERLSAWAVAQADRARAGWLIVAAEWLAPRDPAPRIVTGAGEMAISGKIDRVDAHEEHGWAVIDYKTSDRGDPPERAHKRGGRWIDLQLPLYRTLAAPLASRLGLSGEPALGYFNLPRESSATGVRIASWSREELEEADGLARDVASAVLRGRFEEVGRPDAGGTMGLLCGTGILEIRGEDGEVGGGDEA